MRKLTCIVCPIGCSLEAEGGADLTITGNRCKRGIAYAQEELRAPKRVVTATCGITFSPDSARSLTAPRRVPVKTSAPCPKERIDELLRDIYSLKPGLPIKAGERLIADWQGLGIDVVALRSMT